MRRMRAGAIGAALVLWPAAAFAQVDAEAGAERPLSALVAELGDDQYPVRERATAELLRREDVSCAQIEAELARPDLTPEQRARLTGAARERFLSTPRAAIGVQFGQPRGVPNPNLMGRGTSPTLIAEVFDRFPSKAVLRPGDEIRSVAGVPVEAMPLNGALRNIRPHIVCNDPGDVVKMEVLRDGEVISVDVPMGRFDELPRQIAGRADDIDITDLRTAWSVRVAQRHAWKPGATIVLQPPEGAAPAGRLSPDDEARARAMEGEWPGVVAGGVSRETELETTLRLSGVATADLDAVVRANALGLPAARDDLDRTLNLIRALTAQRDATTASVEQLTRDLSDPNNSGAQRQAIIVKREVLIRQRDSIAAEVALLREEYTRLLRQRQPRP